MRSGGIGTEEKVFLQDLSLQPVASEKIVY